jgi:hypothetical protein
MQRQHPLSRRRHAPVRAALVLVTVALLATGCSKSDDKGASPVPSTAPARSTTTTTMPKSLTPSDLEAAMPTAADIGTGYQRDQSSEGDDGDDGGLQVPDECKALLNQDTKDSVQAERAFKDEAQREVDVEASVTKTDLADLEREAHACQEIPFSSDGAEGVVKISVAPSKGFGDDALVVDFAFVLSAPAAVTLQGHGILAKRGDVGLSVVGFGGISDDLTVTPIDKAFIENTMRQLDQNIEEAQQ